MTLPGWNDLESVARVHRFFEIGGIVVLGTLVIFEIIAYVYGHRKETLIELIQQQEKAAMVAESAKAVEELKLEIAKANERTEQERKKLEHRLIGRIWFGA
jgi:thiosulfate reductase cytochrome b subunit